MNYGQRVQNSVLECMLAEAELLKLKKVDECNRNRDGQFLFLQAWR